MEWFILLNVFCVFLGWRVAERCTVYGGSWWFNMFASALNAVIVLRFVL